MPKFSKYILNETPFYGVNNTYYYIYKIICNIDNTYYFGKCSRTDLRYAGSGKILKEYYLKYPIENFTKIIIKFYKNEAELCEAEKNIIGNLWIDDPLCLNKMPGGYGSFKNMVLVRNKITNKIESIHKDIFNKNKNIYEGYHKNKINVKNKITNKIETINKDDFNNELYETLNKNKLVLINKKTKLCEVLDTLSDFYKNNKDNYYSPSLNKIQVFDLNLNQKILIDKKDYNSDIHVKYIPVYNKILNIHEYIRMDKFDKKIYSGNTKNMVTVAYKNDKDKNFFLITKEEFYKNKNAYITAANNYVTCFDIDKNKYVCVQKDEFYKFKNIKYYTANSYNKKFKNLTHNKFMMTAYDLELKKYVHISKDEYQKNKNIRYYHPTSLKLKEIIKNEKNK